MRRLKLIISFTLFSGLASAATPPDFGSAALTAIYQKAPLVQPSDIRLLGLPQPDQRFLRVAIRKRKFDPTIGEWQLQLECVPLNSCVPAIAMVHSKDPHLFGARTKIQRSAKRVRAGDRLQLCADMGAVRLKRSVVALQAGAAGDRIRVRELRGKRVLIAVVQQDGTLTLRGDL